MEVIAMLNEYPKTGFYLKEIYKGGGELVIKVKQVIKGDEDTLVHLLVYSDKANDLVYNISYNKSDGTIEERKEVKLLKPYLVERINAESLLICVFDIQIVATEAQYEFLLDYINTKKMPPSETINEVMSDNSNDVLISIMREMLAEIKKINSKINHIDVTGSTLLKDLSNAISDVSNQLDSVNTKKMTNNKK